MSRLEFTKATKRAAWERAAGECECSRVPMLGRPQGCGAMLREGNVFYEHVTPDRIKADNSLGNCAVLSRDCWREKTSKYDLPTIAKSNRVRDRSRGIKRATRPMGRAKAPKVVGDKEARLRQMRERP